jgi:hypothetical protein
MLKNVSKLCFRFFSKCSFCHADPIFLRFGTMNIQIFFFVRKSTSRRRAWHRAFFKKVPFHSHKLSFTKFWCRFFMIFGALWLVITFSVLKTNKKKRTMSCPPPWCALSNEKKNLNIHRAKMEKNWMPN